MQDGWGSDGTDPEEAERRAADPDDAFKKLKISFEGHDSGATQSAED